MDFSDDQIDRYARHLVLPEIGEEGQETLLGAKVLVIGAGGLGSPLLLYLAADGVEVSLNNVDGNADIGLLLWADNGVVDNNRIFERGDDAPRRIHAPQYRVQVSWKPCLKRVGHITLLNQFHCGSAWHMGRSGILPAPAQSLPGFGQPAGMCFNQDIYNNTKPISRAAGCWQQRPAGQQTIPLVRTRRSGING